MTHRMSLNWRERDRRVKESGFSIHHDGPDFGWFVLDREHKVVPHWGGTRPEAEQWILDELERREADHG